MQLFYTQHIDGDQAFLKGQEAHHCSNVLRKRKGESIHVLNGQGSRFSGTILSIDRAEVVISILDTRYEEKALLPSIGVGILKSTNRFEWLLEKVTEIGVAEIFPLVCHHSERQKINRSRCQKVLISAIKQSNRAWLPILHEPVRVRDVVNIRSSFKKKYLACYHDKNKFLHSPLDDNQAIVLIGPEGDFSKEELLEAESASFEQVNISTARLRSETAAVVACTLLQYNGS